MRTRKLEEKAEAERTDKEKAEWLAVYRDDYMRSNYATNMLFNSARGFLTSHVIANLDRLETMVNEWASGASSPKDHKLEAFEFAAHEVYDQVRIISFFENWMKALLLTHGVVIHRIQGERFKPFRNAQSSRAVFFTDLDKDGVEVDDLSEYTIGMSDLLKEGYTAITQIPPKILKVVAVINDDRGRIHLNHALTSSFGVDSIADLRMLKEYVNNYVNAIKAAQEERRRAMAGE